MICDDCDRTFVYALRLTLHTIADVAAVARYSAERRDNMCADNTYTTVSLVVTDDADAGDAAADDKRSVSTIILAYGACASAAPSAALACACSIRCDVMAFTHRTQSTDLTLHKYMFVEQTSKANDAMETHGSTR